MGGSPFLPSAAPGGIGLPDVSHVVGLGQSNEYGGQSQPVVSGEDVGFGGRKFERGILTRTLADNPATPGNRAAAGFALVPLKAAVQELYMGETPGIGITSQLRTAFTGGRFTVADLSEATPHYLYTFPHNGGRHLGELDHRDWEATLDTNPNPGPGGYHATFVDDIERARTSAAAAGLSYGVVAFHFTQGENEGRGLLVPGTPVLDFAAFVPAYRADLAAAYARWDGDARAISKQARPIPLFISQVNNHWAGQAQAQLANESASVFNVGPIYYLPSALNAFWNGTQRGAAVHISADGQRWRGEQAGKVMRRVLFEGENWRPLQPNRVRRASPSAIVVGFDVPRPPLVFEVGWLAEATNYGFSASLGTKDAPGAALAVAAVAVTGEREVTITLHERTPLPAGAVAMLSYADTAQVGVTQAVVSAVRAGSAYVHGAESVEVLFAGDLRPQFAKLLVEGCFVLRQYAGAGASIVVRDVRFEGGCTIVRGEATDVAGAILPGYQCGIERDRPFGNLRDSDPALSIFDFADGTYGTRQGQAYPLHNFCINFLWPVET